jgi:hypothetical protein
MRHARHWEGGLLGDVLDGDQALEFKGVVHHQAFELVLVQQCLGFGGAGAVFFIDGDQLSRGVMIWRP